MTVFCDAYDALGGLQNTSPYRYFSLKLISKIFDTSVGGERMERCFETHPTRHTRHGIGQNEPRLEMI